MEQLLREICNHMTVIYKSNYGMSCDLSDIISNRQRKNACQHLIIRMDQTPFCSLRMDITR